MNMKAPISQATVASPVTSTCFQGMPSWWESVPSNPFRLFFPLGLLFGLIGVGHWVLWSVGWNIPNVAFAHAALQTQGFLASFVVGFLMTAFPRFTGTWSATKLELSIMVVSSVSFLLAVLGHAWLISQLFFITQILNLIVFAVRRVPHRSKDLPSSFLLMGFGFLHALLGPVLIVLSGFGTTNFSLFSAGRQMVQVGFLLCMVLGVTGKLAPFLLGYADDPVNGVESNSWLKKGKTAMLFHGFTGAGLLASFFLDLISPQLGTGLRALLVTLHLLIFARMARPLRKKTTLMFFFYLSLWMIPLGLWSSFIFPSYRIAALHIIFLGGFSLMIFSFGLLIVLSHSANAILINSRLLGMRVVGGFILVALVFRIFAEIFSTHYRPMIHTASGLWVLAALVWAGLALPKIWEGVSVRPEQKQ